MPHSTETAAKPAWEVFLDEEIIDEDLTDSYYITENTLYDVIRRMLHAPSNDNDAAATAVEEFRAFYVSYSPDNEERYGFNHESDSAARGLTGLIYEVTWKLSGVIWFRDFKHKRLSDFAVGFKVAAPAVVDIEVWFSRPDARLLVFNICTESANAVRYDHCCTDCSRFLAPVLW
jgi:hypothetical protein